MDLPTLGSFLFYISSLQSLGLVNEYFECVYGAASLVQSDFSIDVNYLKSFLVI